MDPRSGAHRSNGQWAEGAEAETEAGLDGIVDGLRGLIRRGATANPAFTARYWKMVGRPTPGGAREGVAPGGE
jgi:hypothetical protein